MATPQRAPLYHTTPYQSPSITRYANLRVRQSQAPSPRVTPRVSPRHVAPPRVDPIFAVSSHPAAPTAPYVLQGMTGEKIFNTFEEEQLETTSPRMHTTRAWARQHSTHIAHQNAPRILRPITFTATSVCHVAPQKAYNQIPFVTAVINQDTGASFEYRQLIQDEATFPVWNKTAANECGRLAQGVGGSIEGSKIIFFITRQ
jgi:hypothetical protein